MKSEYQEKQRECAVRLLKDGNPIFYGGNGGKMFMRSERDFVLTENEKNFFEPIKEKAIDYFDKNNLRCQNNYLSCTRIFD